MDTVFLTNSNLAGAVLNDVTMHMVEMTNVDLSGASLRNIEYDEFTLRSLEKANLDGASMDDRLKSDLSG
nr:pentapeptide repeat-containing protein [Methanothrix sp.]